MTIINARVKNRIASQTEWLASNPIILKGEIALTISGSFVKFKVGVDGSKRYSELPFNVFDPSNLKGAANPSTDPGIPTSADWYFASPGTYNNFKDTNGNAQIVNGAFGIFSYNGVFWDLINIQAPGITRAMGSFLAQDGGLNVNADGSLIASGTSMFVALDKDYFPVTAGTNPIISLNGNVLGLNWIFFNKTDNKVRVYNYTSGIPINDIDFILLGTFFDTNVDTLNTLSSQILIKGKQPNVTAIISSASNDAVTKINSKFKTVLGSGQIDIANDGTVSTINGTIYKEADTGAFAVVSNPNPIPIKGNNPNGLNWLVVSKETNNVYLKNYTTSQPIDLDSEDIIGYLFNIDLSNLFTLSKVSINGLFKGQLFDTPASGELLLPTKMYFANGVQLPIFKDSIQRNLSERKVRTAFVMDNNILTGADYYYPHFEFFDEQIFVDPDKLVSTFNICGINKDRSVFTSAPVNALIKDPSDLTGRTIKGQQIGDSLTNRGVSIFTYYYLINYNITYNTFGTLNNSGKQGEGREGWSYSNFIGKDNFHHFGGGVIQRMPIPGDGNSLKNPFLKLANNDDKVNHPDWCFRNTGSPNELSYSTDSNKTGNFYIFDYAYYMQSYNIPADLDVITIALSTNDFTINSSTAVDNCKFALTVMLTQIRAALPNVKIGVIPTASYGMSIDGDQRFSLVADWINQSQKLLIALGLSYVDIIGVWAHMSRYFNWPTDSDAPLSQDGNTTVLHTIGEFIHFNENGYKQYSPALGNWIMNVI